MFYVFCRREVIWEICLRYWCWICAKAHISSFSHIQLSSLLMLNISSLLMLNMCKSTYFFLLSYSTVFVIDVEYVQKHIFLPSLIFNCLLHIFLLSYNLSRTPSDITYYIWTANWSYFCFSIHFIVYWKKESVWESCVLPSRDNVFLHHSNSIRS